MTPIANVSESIRKHLPAFIFGPTLKMIEAVFDLLIPLFMKAVIDLTKGASQNRLTGGISRFIQSFGTWVPDNPTVNYALIGGFWILMMSIVGFVITMITQYIAARTCVQVGTDVRDSLYARILSLSKKERERIGNSRLLTILNSDSYQVQQGVLIFIRLIVRAPFVILGALAVSLILNWEIGLVFVAIIPLILFVIFFIMGKCSKEYLGIQNRLDTLSVQTSDTLDGSKVIRAFNREDYENHHFEQATKAYENQSIKVSRLNSLINPLTFGIIALATTAVILFGGLPIFASPNGADDIAVSSTIVTEVAYLSQIFVTLIQLTNVVMVLTKAKVSRKRVDDVLAIQPSIHDDDKAITRTISEGEEILAFHHVDLGYKDGGNLALTDIDFTLYKGQSLGIIGGTGCGKSTLVNLVERFLDATHGEVDYKGSNIKDYSLSSLRSELGLVPQKSVLFKGTIRSNLLMSNPQATDEEMTAALKNAMAYEFVSRYPEYLDYGVEEGGKNFSGGQRQRLCIARGLVKAPEVIILDDSTSALDLLTDKTVRHNIATDYPGMTKILVSQRVSTVMDCDLILVLEGGKVIGKGRHEELMSSCKAYQETYESQTSKEAE